MKKIQICDITLAHHSEKSGAALSFQEKIEVAQHLAKMGVDVIETAPIENVKTDTLFLKTMNAFVKNTVLSVPCGMDEKSIDIAWSGVSKAEKPRLLLSLPVSTIGMEYTCHKKPPKILEMIQRLVSYARSLCTDVEFQAEDATRSEMDFLISAIKTAAEAGASTITLCDSEGAMLPEEFGAFVADVIEKANMDNVTFLAQCSNNLGMAVASAVSSIKNGCMGIKTIACGGSYTTTEAFSSFARVRGDSCGFTTSLNTSTLVRLSNQVKWILEGNKGNGAHAGSTARAEDDDHFILTIQDDKDTVVKAAAMLGYDLSEEDETKVFEAFQRVAVKKTVGVKELDAIIASAALQVPPTYKIKSYVINSGNIITATANIELEKEGKVYRGISLGDGPIDAAFLAIEQILGYHYDLDDFQIQSVTEGTEAMGSAIIKIREDGKMYSGNGISTDIIGASIRAYINAVNKILYEQQN